MTQDTTPTEEKKEETSDFAEGTIFVVGCVFAVIGVLFVAWHSDTIAGFVFKPWMQVTEVQQLDARMDAVQNDPTTLIAASEKLRKEIRMCAEGTTVVEMDIATTTVRFRPQSMQDCLKTL